MARTLSDALIISMIEATTRLAASQNTPARTAASGETPAEGAAETKDHKEARTAAQLGADFATIYHQIEEVVRVSAEQETKTVGFSVR